MPIRWQHPRGRFLGVPSRQFPCRRKHPKAMAARADGGRRTPHRNRTETGAVHTLRPVSYPRAAPMAPSR